MPQNDFVASDDEGFEAWRCALLWFGKAANRIVIAARHGCFAPELQKAADESLVCIKIKKSQYFRFMIVR